ncbi:MAG: hypothetical protein WCK90_02870 [archaeon]
MQREEIPEIPNGTRLYQHERMYADRKLIGVFFHNKELGKGFYFANASDLTDFISLSCKGEGIGFDRQFISVAGLVDEILKSQIPIYLGKNTLNDRLQEAVKN